MTYSLFADGPFRGQWRKTHGVPFVCVDPADHETKIVYRSHRVYILGRIVSVYAIEPPSPQGVELAEYLLSPGALAEGSPPPQPQVATVTMQQTPTWPECVARELNAGPR